MALGSKQIVQAIETVNQVAEAGANSSQDEEQLATMEEISASAQSLANLAGEMQNLLGQFKI